MKAGLVRVPVRSRGEVRYDGWRGGLGWVMRINMVSSRAISIARFTYAGVGAGAATHLGQLVHLTLVLRLQVTHAIQTGRKGTNMCFMPSFLLVVCILHLE